jgi:hypothetical protein
VSRASGQLGEGDPAGDSVGVSVGDTVGVSVGVSVAGSLGGTEAGSDAGAVPVGAAAEGDGDGPPACWLLKSHHAATRMSTTSRAPRISGVLLRRSRTVIGSLPDRDLHKFDFGGAHEKRVDSFNDVANADQDGWKPRGTRRIPSGWNPFRPVALSRPDPMRRNG